MDVVPTDSVQRSSGGQPSPKEKWVVRKMADVEDAEGEAGGSNKVAVRRVRLVVVVLPQPLCELLAPVLMAVSVAAACAAPVAVTVMVAAAVSRG